MDDIAEGLNLTLVAAIEQLRGRAPVHVHQFIVHQFIVHQFIVHQFIVHQFIVHQFIVHQFMTVLSN